MLRAVMLAAGAGWLAYLVVDLGPGEIAALLGRVGWGFVPLAVVYAAYQAVRAAALRLAAARPDDVGLLEAFGVRLSGEAVQFLTSTGPFLAEPSRALLLSRRGLTRIEGFAAAMAEYFSNLFVAAAMLAFAMVYLLVSPEVTIGPNLRAGAVALLAVSLSFLAVAAMAIEKRFYLIGGVVNLLRRVPGIASRIRADAGDVRRMEDVLLGVLREDPLRFARILLLEAFAHALLVAELWWILHTTGVTSSLGDALVLEAAGKFTTLVFFFIPGQVGAAEGVNAVLFHAIGFASVAGVGVALARRIRTMMAASAGLIAMALLTRR